MITAAIILAVLPLCLAAVNGPCSIDGTPGVCITTSNCAAGDGSFRSGFCPNDPDNVKCCIKPECGSGGNCRFTSSCSGTTKTGLCPGPATFKCCEPKKGTPGGGTTADHSLSAKGVDFIAGFEGFRANSYNDAAVSSPPYAWVLLLLLIFWSGRQNYRLRARLPAGKLLQQYTPTHH